MGSVAKLGSPVRRIFPGGNFAMLQLADGRVFALGKNNDGQLGLGYFNASESPVAVAQEVKSLRDAQDIQLGSLHGVALLSDASVRVWGAGKYGRTARTDAQNLHTPTELYPAGAAEVIGAGKQTSFVWLRTAKLMAFGFNAKGALGFPPDDTSCPCTVSDCTNWDAKCSLAPKEVTHGLLATDKVLQISGGEGHTFLRTTGHVYAAGANTMKQLGVRSCGSQDCHYFTPLLDLQGQQIVGVDAGTDWGYAWRRVLEVPTFNPPPGEHGPLKLRVEPADALSGIDIYYTVVADSAEFRPAPHPNYTSDAQYEGIKLAGEGTVTLDQPPLFYTVRAMAACASCGASYSPTVEARYRIVNKVSTPVFQRCHELSPSGCHASAASSTSSDASSPSFICAPQISGESPPLEKLGQECGQGGLGAMDQRTCSDGACIQTTGLWQYPVRVSISVEQAEAKIYYTVDGTRPSAASSKLYSGPFDLIDSASRTNVTVRAVGVLAEFVDSDVGSGLYEVADDVAAGGRKGLPLWALIVTVSAGVLLLLCCSAALFLYVRLRQLSNKVSNKVDPWDQEEANVHTHEHRPHHAHHHHNNHPPEPQTIAVPVHVLHTPNPEALHVKTHIAQDTSSGILRPITDRQLNGLEVEREVHEGTNSEQLALSSQDLEKFKDFQDIQKWKRLTAEERERHSKGMQAWHSKAQDAGWDVHKHPVDRAHRGHHHHKHDHPRADTEDEHNENHHHHHHHRHHHRRHHHHFVGGKGDEEGRHDDHLALRTQPGGVVALYVHRQHSPEKSAEELQRASLLLGDEPEVHSLSDDERLSWAAAQRHVHLGAVHELDGESPSTAGGQGAGNPVTKPVTKPNGNAGPLRRSTSRDSLRLRDLPHDWLKGIKAFNPRDIDTEEGQ